MSYSGYKYTTFSRAAGLFDASTIKKKKTAGSLLWVVRNLLLFRKRGQASKQAKCERRKVRLKRYSSDSKETFF